MEFRIPIHSVVDVITNSSSVIYTEATRAAIDTAKSMINEILSIAGSDKTADDLFDFQTRAYPVEKNEWVLDRKNDYASLGTLTGVDELNTIYQERTDWALRSKKEAEWIRNHQAEIDAIIESETFAPDIESGILTHLVVKSKTGIPLEMEKKFLRMFESQEVSN
jgi:hypothetical protein